MSENTIGREPLQIIEIEQPLCSLEYGVSPCTAALALPAASNVLTPQRPVRTAELRP